MNGPLSNAAEDFPALFTTTPEPPMAPGKVRIAIRLDEDLGGLFRRHRRPVGRQGRLPNYVEGRIIREEMGRNSAA
jgi:hypothetical protein